jgi:hypothetical protein
LIEVDAINYDWPPYSSGFRDPYGRKKRKKKKEKRRQKKDLIRSGFGVTQSCAHKSSMTWAWHREWPAS